ncbi:MAG: radical SAM protein [Pseudomonadales bacterium]|nr:radical SAM protein [Pseudomonadales bacterium]
MEQESTATGQAAHTLDPLIARLPVGKFNDPRVTLDGQPRATVAPTALDTLWFNTGTLCNLTCATCYIESSPRNDRLTWLARAEVVRFLADAAALPRPPRTIGFTGGEPFMNPDIIDMLQDALAAGFEALVLTNAMRPMMKLAVPLFALRDAHGPRLTIRVSVDHYTRELHESERGRRSWAPMLKGLEWLAVNGFTLHVAGRARWNEPEDALRAGYATLFRTHGIAVDAHDPAQLVLFPEMDERADVPEITEACWGILGKQPESVMCASSRMVVKRNGATAPVVLACTLIAYDPRFELGSDLAGSLVPVALNHPHCAKFCVLGGASCSAG